jgi:hypothetical protein
MAPVFEPAATLVFNHSQSSVLHIPSGKNRVMSSTMVVFERIDLAPGPRVVGERGRIAHELAPSPSRTRSSETALFPDGRMSAHFSRWLETDAAQGGYASECHDRN